MLTTTKSPFVVAESGKQNWNDNVVYPSTPNSRTQFYLVSSGMGGHEKSEVGAKLVAQYIVEFFEKSKSPEKKRLGQVYVNDALRYAERRLQNYIAENSRMFDTEGSVAFMQINDDGSISIGWIGNCRVYHIRNGEILFRTEDHVTSYWDTKRNNLFKPRAINASDPAWASVSTLTDVLAGDYLFLCTPGVIEVFDDRHIRYLFSQSDGADATNQAIIQKIKEECSKSSQQDYSFFLIPIEKTPFVATERKQTHIPTAAAVNRAMTGQIKTGTVIPPPKNPTGAIEMPRREFKVELPEVNFNGRMLRNIFIGLGMLLVVSGLLYYAMQRSKPENLFADYIKNAETHNQAGAYDSAITELQKALSLDISDSLRQIANQKLHANQQHLAEREAKTWLDKGNLLKAKASYETAYRLDSSNIGIQKQITELIATIETEKKKLMLSADSLLKKGQFDDAKNLLFDALYLDQSNQRIFKAINYCNLKMQQDTISYDLAVREAVEKAETGKRSLATQSTPPPASVTLPSVDSTAIKAAQARKRRRQQDDSINSFYQGNTYNSYPSNGGGNAGMSTVRSGSEGTVNYGVSSTTIKRSEPSYSPPPTRTTVTPISPNNGTQMQPTTPVETPPPPSNEAPPQ